MPAVPINMGSAEVSAEVHFAQKLASNEKKIRDRAIKRLRKYLFARSSHGGLTEGDHVKIWKGLHYCMWMQDKPLLQEELSQKISSLLQSFSSPEGALLFMKVFLETEAREWVGIDKLRLDKFMMMIRDMLHQTFTLLSNISWPEAECRQFAQALALKVMLPGEPRLPDGLKLHLADIYVDELVKVPLDEMSSKKMVLLLRPFIDFLVYTSKPELAAKVMHDVIGKVLNTLSSVKPKTQSTSQVNSAKSRQNEEDEESGDGVDDEEMDENVDIYEDGMEVDEEAPADENNINFVMDADLLLLLLFQLAKDPTVKAKNRALVYKLVKKYPQIYDNVLNLLNSSSGDHQTNSNLEGSTSKTLDDLALFPKDGQHGDQKQQQQKNRRKRKNKDNRIEGEGEVKDMKHTETLIVTELHNHSENQNKERPGKNGKVRTDREGNMPIASVNPLKRKKGKSDGDDHTEQKSRKVLPELRPQSAESTPVAAQTKSKKKKTKKAELESSNQSEPIISNNLKLAESTLIASKAKPKKKKKTKETEVENSSNLSTVVSDPLNSNHSAVSLINNQDTKHEESSPQDENSNARGASKNSPRKSAADIFSCPVQMVVYAKQATPVKETSGARSRGRKREKSTDKVDEHSPLTSSKNHRVPLFTKGKSSQSPSESSPCSSQSSLSLALELFSAAADRKKSGKKGRDSSESPSTSSGLCDESGDYERSEDGKVEKEPSGPKSGGTFGGVMNEVKSVFTSMKQLVLQGIESKSSESSMDWSQGAHDTSAASMASQSCDSEGDMSSSKEIGSQTDPGPDRKKGKCRMKDSKQSLTPSHKKKVVFDLRRNSANRFVDYIKSLQKQRESPHLPEKSPSNSILKSGASPIAINKKKLARTSSKSRQMKKGSRGNSLSPSASPRRPKSARSRPSINIS